jgi:hypothetical protein
VETGSSKRIPKIIEIFDSNEIFPQKISLHCNYGHKLKTNAINGSNQHHKFN